MFSFHHWLLLLFSGVFIFDYLWSLHHCFFRCFYFITDFIIVFQVFSFHKLSSPGLFFVRYFVFVFFYHECYGSERAFFTLRCFLSCTLSRHLTQTAFIEASLGPTVPPWRLWGLPLSFETQTWSMFVWITQCSAKGISQ